MIAPALFDLCFTMLQFALFLFELKQIATSECSVNTTLQSKKKTLNV